MERSIDWLTLTLKPEVDTPCSSEENYGKVIGLLRVTLHLGELLDKMSTKGKARYYEERLEYNDINIKFSAPDKFNKQGVCIELSSNGLSYFCEYLASYGYDLKMWCAKWRALAVRGEWITKCTRFDNAMDDKAYNGDRPKLTMNKVITAVCDDELCCKSRTWLADLSDLVHLKQNYKSRNGKKLCGTTFSLGNRDSKTYVRFYDKKVEQAQKGESLPDNLTSWVRCEFEYHEENAMSVFNAYVDMSDIDFGEYLCGCALNHVRFIDRVASNVSRCPVKRWWKEFLNGCAKKQTMHKVEPVRTALSRALRGINQYAATILTIMSEWGEEGFCDYMHALGEDMKHEQKRTYREDIVHNLKDKKRFYEVMNGFKHWSYATDLSDDELRANIEKQRMMFSQQDYKIYRAPEEWGDGQNHIGVYAHGM